MYNKAYCLDYTDKKVLVMYLKLLDGVARLFGDV